MKDSRDAPQGYLWTSFRNQTQGSKTKSSLQQLVGLGLLMCFLFLVRMAQVMGFCSAPRPIQAGLSSSGCAGVERAEVVEMRQKQESSEISFTNGEGRHKERKTFCTNPVEWPLFNS